MRLFAYVLITVSLTVGAIAAVTAYVPRLSAVQASATPLTLNADVGRLPGNPEAPLVSPDSSDAPVLLTDTLGARLAAAGVRRVRVKEFAWGRWDAGWFFLTALVGLLAGGLIIRREDRQQMAALLEREPEETETPEYALRAAHDAVAALRRDVEGLDRAQQATEITRRVGDLQLTHLIAFVDARPELVGRFGIGGYARLMDPFAAGERQLNRAWSAAADGALAEALASLERGQEALAEALRRLAARG